MFYLASDKVLRHCLLSNKMSNDGTNDSVHADEDNGKLANGEKM